MQANRSPGLTSGVVLLIFLVAGLFWSLQKPGLKVTEEPAPRAAEKPADPLSVAPPGTTGTLSSPNLAPVAPAAPKVPPGGDVLSAADITTLVNALLAGGDARAQLMKPQSNSSAAMMAAREEFFEVVLRFGPMAYAEVLQDPAVGPVLQRMIQTPQDLKSFRRSMAKVAAYAKVELPIEQAESMSDLVVLAEQLATAVRTRREGKIGGDLSPQHAAQAALMARASVLAETAHNYARTRRLTFDLKQQKFIPYPADARTDGLQIIRKDDSPSGAR